jgi:hypothetical protein
MGTLCRLISVVLMALLLSACYRGEARKLQEVLADSRTNYLQALSRANAGGLDPAVQGKLNEVSRITDGILDSPAASNSAENWLRIEDLLRDLAAKAGYPSRAAMTELAREVRGLGKSEEEPAIGEQAPAQRQSSRMLLASRIFQLLSSELGTAKFRL